MSMIERIFNALVTLVKGPLSAEAIRERLAEAAKSVPEASNWNGSIVDLLKVLKLGSSLAERRTLYREYEGLGKYTGSAEQNIWLHQQVMADVGRRYRGAS